MHCSQSMAFFGIILILKSLRLRPPTPEAYGKTADFGTLCIPGSSQRLDPSAALLSSSDRSQLAALNVMLTPCPVPRLSCIFQGFQGGCKGGPGGPEALQPAVNTKNETNVPELYAKPITQHPVLCAGGSSRTNGSRYPPPQRTPRPSRVASTGFINFSMAFLPSLK